jgi:hypothetical protein
MSVWYVAPGEFTQTTKQTHPLVIDAWKEDKINLLETHLLEIYNDYRRSNE